VLVSLLLLLVQVQVSVLFSVLFCWVCLVTLFLRDELFKYAILGFALTEAVGLLGLMMAFLILFI